jgi:hypothetical protein
MPKVADVTVVNAQPQPAGAGWLPPRREIKPIAKNKFWPIGYKHNHLNVHLDESVQPQDLENPELYSLIKESLRAFDIVNVIHPHWWAEVLIRWNEQHGPVQVVVLRVVQLPAPLEGGLDVLPQGHSIRYDASDSTYQGWRDRDNVPLTPKLPSRELARRELVDHASLKAR